MTSYCGLWLVHIPYGRGHKQGIPLTTKNSACCCCCYYCTMVLQAVKPKVTFRVQPAYFELAPRIASAISQAINTGTSAEPSSPNPPALCSHACRVVGSGFTCCPFILSSFLLLCMDMQRTALCIWRTNNNVPVPAAAAAAALTAGGLCFYLLLLFCSHNSLHQGLSTPHGAS